MTQSVDQRLARKRMTQLVDGRLAWTPMAQPVDGRLARKPMTQPVVRRLAWRLGRKPMTQPVPNRRLAQKLMAALVLMHQKQAADLVMVSHHWYRSAQQCFAKWQTHPVAPFAEQQQLFARIRMHAHNEREERRAHVRTSGGTHTHRVEGGAHVSWQTLTSPGKRSVERVAHGRSRRVWSSRREGHTHTRRDVGWGGGQWGRQNSKNNCPAEKAGARAIGHLSRHLKCQATTDPACAVHPLYEYLASRYPYHLSDGAKVQLY